MWLKAPEQLLKGPCGEIVFNVNPAGEVEGSFLTLRRAALENYSQHTVNLLYVFLSFQPHPHGDQASPTYIIW